MTGTHARLHDKGAASALDTRRRNKRRRFIKHLFIRLHPPHIHKLLKFPHQSENEQDPECWRNADSQHQWQRDISQGTLASGGGVLTRDSGGVHVERLVLARLGGSGVDVESEVLARLGVGVVDVKSEILTRLHGSGVDKERLVLTRLGGSGVDIEREVLTRLHVSIGDVEGVVGARNRGLRVGR